MKILAIGGSVIKENLKELRVICERRYIDVLIHCGGSLFHDFQRATEELPGHSYPLDQLVDDYEVNRAASKLVWKWIDTWDAPKNSITNICQENEIRVMLFTILGADFWQLFDDRWEVVARKSHWDFEHLCALMKSEFHFINMGSAVVMPEVFTKALAVAKPKKFQADVVDFLPKVYRAQTRVAKFGKYYCMTFKEFFDQWISFDGDLKRVEEWDSYRKAYLE